MWAQMVKFRVPEGKAEQMQAVNSEWENKVGRGTDSGWVESVVLRNQKDPGEWYALVFFDSEEKARANEQTQLHQDTVKKMEGFMTAQPEFVDLEIVGESKR